MERIGPYIVQRKSVRQPSEATQSDQGTLSMMCNHSTKNVCYGGLPSLTGYIWEQLKSPLLSNTIFFCDSTNTYHAQGPHIINYLMLTTTCVTPVGGPGLCHPQRMNCPWCSWSLTSSILQQTQIHPERTYDLFSMFVRTPKWWLKEVVCLCLIKAYMD